MPGCHPPPIPGTRISRWRRVIGSLHPLTQHPLRINGVDLIADLSGVLWWPAQRTLVVADLHLEKGSGFAAKGALIPPYDTAATLARLGHAIARLEPDRVICLGDSFHDGGAAARLSAADAQTITGLTAPRDWIWITGNHDPEPPADWGGRVLDELVDGALVFRHQARPGSVGELSGHFHPKASVRTRARRISARCFVGDGYRLILPAFGAYTGGLDVLDPAISGLLDRGFQVQLLGPSRLHSLPRSGLTRRRIRSGGPSPTTKLT